MNKEELQGRLSLTTEQDKAPLESVCSEENQCRSAGNN